MCVCVCGYFCRELLCIALAAGAFNICTIASLHWCLHYTHTTPSFSHTSNHPHPLSLSHPSILLSFQSVRLLGKHECWMFEAKGACINVSLSLSLSLSLSFSLRISRRTYGASQATEPKRSGEEKKWTEREEECKNSTLWAPLSDFSNIVHQKKKNHPHWQ